MTENKRFRVFKYPDCKEYGVSDDIAEYTLARFDNHFEAEGLCELLNELHEENQKLKEDAKQVLFVLACCNRDFGLSVNEAKAIKRLNECVDGCYNINNIKEYLND
jgi:hypothetical protein